MNEFIKEAKDKLAAAVSVLKEEMTGFRSNRPTTKSVEDIKVDYMGSMTPLKHVASISIEPPRDIVVSPWDKSVLPNIEKALQEANIGLNVASQGNVVRAKLPELTDERRNELIKVVKNAVEEIRIRIRMIRDDINKKIKDIKDEDERFKTKEDLQKEVDATNKQVEDMLSSKIKEIEE